LGVNQLNGNVALVRRVRATLERLSPLAWVPILFVANLGLVVADAANLYANGHDLKDPMRKLRAAGVVADLMVFEGQSHAQYLFVPDAPEGKEYFIEVTAFFDKPPRKVSETVQHVGYFHPDSTLR
jgi:hypothetical protein